MPIEAEDGRSELAVQLDEAVLAYGPLDRRDPRDQQQGDEQQVRPGHGGDAADGREDSPGAGEHARGLDGGDQGDADEQADRPEHGEQPRQQPARPGPRRCGARARALSWQRPFALARLPAAGVGGRAAGAFPVCVHDTVSSRAGLCRRPRVQFSRVLSPGVHERAMNVGVHHDLRHRRCWETRCQRKTTSSPTVSVCSSSCGWRTGTLVGWCDAVPRARLPAQPGCRPPALSRARWRCTRCPGPAA